MIERASVCWAKHEFLYQTEDGSIHADLRPHPLLALLPAEVATACGFQVVAMGTLSARSRTNAPLIVHPFEFAAGWENAAGARSPTIWKAHSLQLTSQLLPADIDGRVVTSWDKTLSRQLAAMTTDEHTARLALRGRAYARPAWLSRIDVHCGEIIRYRDRAVVVLSNDYFNTNHPFGLLVVAPFTDDRLAVDGCIRNEPHRIVYEMIQVVQPTALDQLAPTGHALSGSMVAHTQRAAIAFLRSMPPNGVSKPAFLHYLERSAAEREGRSIPLQLSGLVEPYDSNPPPIVSITRTLPRQGRALSTAEPPLLVGTEMFDLGIDGEVFGFQVQRHEAHLHVFVEPRDRVYEDNEVLYAWVETHDGRVLDEFVPSQADVPFVQLDAGILTTDTTVLIVGATCPYETRRFELRLSWKRP